MAGEEELELELPARPVALVDVRGTRGMRSDPLPAAHAISRAPRQAFERYALHLALPRRRDLERLPERLVPVAHVQHVGECAEAEPAQEDHRRVRDVLEDELREHSADEQRAHKRKDGDAVAPELDVQRHPIGTVQRRLDETQPHHGQVCRTERERRRQRVDGAHEVDLRAARYDTREDEHGRGQAEDDDGDIRRLEFGVELGETVR